MIPILNTHCWSIIGESDVTGLLLLAVVENDVRNPKIIRLDSQHLDVVEVGRGPG